MRSHSDWETNGFDLEPIARAVGPFPRRPMLRAWWDVCIPEGEAVFVETDAALLALHRHGDEYKMLGEADLFDYHSPLGPGVDATLADWATDLAPGSAIDFDSLPAAAADEITSGLTKAGIGFEAAVHETAAVLELPDSYDAYLAGLDKKQRHETRRKGRRFTEAIGEPRLVRDSSEGAVARFAAMHRKSSGDKGEFMTDQTEAFFARLAAEAGAVIDWLYAGGETPVAAGFGFEDQTAYYLYNSAYDPDAAAASPGIVLVSEMIRQAIESKKDRFDFLKGDEVYKYRLGAEARPLWRIRAIVGGES